MEDREVTSPEVANRKKFAGRSREFIMIQHQKTLEKWKHHADSRTIDWQWTSIPYNRVAVINLLLSKFENPNYLEIGCAGNYLYDSVHARKKTGVDPDSGGNVRKTSDDFYADNKEMFDVTFIDGLHLYEQVRRDVINAIKSTPNGGWIALHDMLPGNWVEHHIPLISLGAWNGDVWKVAFELMQTKGVEFKILKIDYGVGVIKVLDNTAQLPDMREELVTKEFNYYYDNLDNMPITPWEDAQE